MSNLTFKKYPSIENSYRKKFIDKMIDTDASIKQEDYIIVEKIDGCLEKNVVIMTREFGEVPIGWIIDNKIECHVLSYNKVNNSKEWDKIISHQNKPDNGKEWFQINLEDGSKINITGNHRVYLPKKGKYLPVNELSDGDFLLKR